MQTPSLEESVRASAATAAGAAHDRALLDLALGYARLIDNAQPTTALARALDTIAPHVPADPATADAWRKITTTLAEHSVASDLGPKLLAALDALLLTPRARAAAKKAVTPNDKPAEPPANPLDELAKRRAGLGNPPAVDAGAS